MLVMAGWYKSAGLVHQRNSEKIVSKPHPTLHFVSCDILHIHDGVTILREYWFFVSDGNIFYKKCG